MDMTDPPPSWLLTRRLMQKKGQRRLFAKLDEARAEFPEFIGRTIKVGVSSYAEGKAQKDRMAIWLRSREVSLNTVGHELMHLVQGLGSVPSGERSCDVYTLARSVKFCDSKPYYLKVPRAFIGEDRAIRPSLRIVLHMVAKEAVGRRELGERNYITWFEKELASYAEALL